MASLAGIQQFLARKRFAVVGVSSNPKDYTRLLFKELRTRGYDAVPVNPGVRDIDGVTCFPTVRDLDPPVEAALLLTRDPVTSQVVRECAEAGVRQVWVRRSLDAGTQNFCEAKSIDAVWGECPFMFLPQGIWIHRLHGACRKLVGSYPR